MSKRSKRTVARLRANLFLFQVSRHSDVHDVSKSDDELRQEALDSLAVDYQDACVYPAPCKYFYLILSASPLHGLSWSKHKADSGGYLHKGCKKYVLGHNHIVKSCPIKQTSELGDFDK